MDRYGFKLLLYLITTLELIISGSFYFLTINEIIFTIYIVFVLICIGGTFAILAPEFSKIFGIINGTEIYGIAIVFIGNAHLIACIFSKFIIKKKTDYFLSFLILGNFCVIKLGILIFFKDRRYINTKNIDINNKRESSLTEDPF